jgi:hypothetical protein
LSVVIGGYAKWAVTIEFQNAGRRQKQKEPKNEWPFALMEVAVDRWGTTFAGFWAAKW